LKDSSSVVTTKEYILSLAVTHARSLDPHKFDIQDVYTAVGNESSSWTEVVPRPQLKEQVLQHLSPPDDVLYTVVDKTFLQTDLQRTTVKQVIVTVQKEFPVSFSTETRKKIKKRLTDLMNKQVVPRVSVQPAAISRLVDGACTDKKSLQEADLSAPRKQDSETFVAADSESNRASSKLEDVKLVGATSMDGAASKLERVEQAKPCKILPEIKTRPAGTGLPIDQVAAAAKEVISSRAPEASISDEEDDLAFLLGEDKPVFSKSSKPTQQTDCSSTALLASSKTLKDLKQDPSSISMERPLTSRHQESVNAPSSVDIGESSSSRAPLLTEIQIFALAEKHARSLPSDKFEIKHVYAALKNVTGDDSWTAIAKRPQVREHVLQQLGPSVDTLYVVVDETFTQTDLQRTTVKQLVASVQTRFPIPFSLETRKKIKDRLTELMNKKVTPRVSTSGSANLSNPREHKQDSGWESKKKSEDIMVVDRSIPSQSTATENTVPRQQTKAAKTIPETKTRAEGIKPMGMSAQNEGPGATEQQKPVRRGRAAKLVDANESFSTATLPLASMPAPRRGRKRKTDCQLCSNCPCGHAATEAGARMSLLDLSQSDAAIEKALIRRLQKMEKSADHYENQTDAIRRTLKKHRREMWKKREQREGSEKSSRPSRFLPDSGELVQRMKGVKPSKPLPGQKVKSAQNKMFAFAPTFQPTLTQMFGGNANNEDDEQPKDETHAPLDMIFEAGGEAESSNPIPECGAVKNDEPAEHSDCEMGDEVDDLSPDDPVPFSRLECRDGSEHRDPSGPEPTNRSLWVSMLTGNYDSSWDRIFTDPGEDDGDSVMDDLIGLLDEDSRHDEISNSQSSAMEMPMLSQRGQRLAENIVNQVTDDPKSLSALNQDCPMWRENVLYTLRQRDGADVNDALSKVQDAKTKLLEAKAAMSQAFERKAAVLNFFENAMQESLARFEASQQDAATTEGFMPSQETVAQDTPSSPRRQSFASEVPTDCEMDSPMSIASRETIIVAN
jgi:hypothetical protein